MEKNITALAMLSVLLLATPILFTTAIVNAESEAYVVAEHRSGALSFVTPAGERTVIYQFPEFQIQGFTVDSSGNYIVPEMKSSITVPNDALSKVTPDGVRTIIYNFSRYTYPFNVDIEPSGNYLVVEAGKEGLANIISEVTPDGVRTVKYNFSSSGLGTSELVIDSSGNYIMCDLMACLLWKVNPAGEISMIYNFSKVTGPVAFAIDSSGNYIVCEDGAETLSKVTPNGERTVIYKFPRYTSPTDVAIDSSGNYIVAEYETNILSKVTPDGVRTVIYDFGQGASPMGVACITVSSSSVSTQTTWILVGVAAVAVVAIAAGVFMFKKRK